MTKIPSPTIMAGPPSILGQTLSQTAQILASEPIFVIDGSNRFRVDHLAKMAKIMGLKPHRVLGNVFLSRAFTCHQLTELICHRTYTRLREKKSRHLVLVGLLDTFYDENVPLPEAKRLLKQTILSIRRLSRIASITIVQPQWHEIAGPRKEFVNYLKHNFEGTKPFLCLQN